jgi:hypothetical protein
MKLTSAQVQKALTQYQGQPIPENHQLVPPLNERFGDHTFFLDGNGLNIVEPASQAAQETSRQEMSQAARVVNLASWSDENRTKLLAHEPEPTDTFVELVAH